MPLVASSESPLVFIIAKFVSRLEENAYLLIGSGVYVLSSWKYSQKKNLDMNEG